MSRRVTDRLIDGRIYKLRCLQPALSHIPDMLLRIECSNAGFGKFNQEQAVVNLLKLWPRRSQ